MHRRQGSRPSPWKINEKWLSKEALQIAVEKREKQKAKEKRKDIPI